MRTSPADTVTELRAEEIIATELRRIKRSPATEAAGEEDAEDAGAILAALRRERLKVVEVPHG